MIFIISVEKWEYFKIWKNKSSFALSVDVIIRVIKS